MICQHLFLLLLGAYLLSHTIDCKKGGSSGGSVGSKSRGGVMNTIKNSITGNRANQQKPHGTWGGNTNTGFKAKPAPIPSYGKPSWTSNAGRSTFQSSSNKKALLAGGLGAMIGAYGGYKLGQAVHRPYHHGGRDYWYGSRHYTPTYTTGRRTCIFEVGPSVNEWNLQYEDKTRVNEIVFECMSYETCCEMSCCRAPSGGHRRVNGGHMHGWHWWHTFLTLTVMAAIVFACALAASRMRQSRRQENQVVFTQYDEAAKPLNDAVAVGESYPPPPAGTYSAPQIPLYPPAAAGFAPQYPTYPSAPQVYPQAYPAHPQPPPAYA